jgi:hypothetical protein
MSLRAQRLNETADRQIAELAERLSSADEAALYRPCPGRARLGDGTVGAVAAFATDNYGRIAEFVGAVPDGGPQHQVSQHGQGHRAADVELEILLARLATAPDALARIAQLSDDQLDSVPSAGAMRFADGNRTLEQIVASLFKHQRHQVDAITAALS